MGIDSLWKPIYKVFGGYSTAIGIGIKSILEFFLANGKTEKAWTYYLSLDVDLTSCGWLIVLAVPGQMVMIYCSDCGVSVMARVLLLRVLMLKVLLIPVGRVPIRLLAFAIVCSLCFLERLVVNLSANLVF
ncbi:hypothetical protein Tco_1041549 [Tanacetum coccineum]|uniref:Uncharacterized protein n=1 Tax=Tanacetum coccineum TaxID=301880 RepID=A0ABQ5GI44_9ASTR